MKVLILGDLHFPFHHRAALTWTLDLIKACKPSTIVQIGDLFDLFSLSRFARGHNLMTPRQEIVEARACADELWRVIRTYSRKSGLYQILGNHDCRLKARVIEKLPELDGLVNYRGLFEFPGVQTIHDDREELVLDGIVYMHGYRSKLGDHAKYNLMNTVTGHSHRGGVFHTKIRGTPLWELNAGFLADPTSIPLSYRKQRWDDWTLGCGLILEHGPLFSPFPLK